MAVAVLYKETPYLLIEPSGFLVSVGIGVPGILIASAERIAWRIRGLEA